MPTALIVEDEPQANKLLAMLVQLHGYTTESAFTGPEALEKVRGPRPGRRLPRPDASRSRRLRGVPGT